jgi:hypothetical protein
MKDTWVKKGLVCGIIVLLLGMSIMPIAGSLSIEKEHSVLTKGCSDDIVITGTMGENGWYISDVTVIFVGGNYTHFRIDGGNWIVYTAPFVISTDGIHLIEATYDFEHIYNITIKIDQTAPIFNDVIAKRVGFFKWRVATNITDNTSGINIVEFYIDSCLIGADTELPYEITWSYNFMTWLRLFILINLMGQWWRGLDILAIDNAGNIVVYPPISARVDIITFPCFINILSFTS